MALGGTADGVPVSSPKSMVGHLIGAAGALSAMVCLLAMRDGDPAADDQPATRPIRNATSMRAAAGANGDRAHDGGQRVRLRRAELRDRAARGR